MPAATTSKTIARVPFLVADSFVLALDDFMRRTHQGGHVSQSVIELDRPPDPVRLRDGLRRAVAKFPLLAARPVAIGERGCLTGPCPPPRRSPDCRLAGGGRARSLPVHRFADATPTADVWKLVQWLSNEPLVVDGMEFNARVDVVARRDGRFWLLVTWSHLLFDGKGAELFCAELARLCDGIDLPEETARRAAPAHGSRGWRNSAERNRRWTTRRACRKRACHPWVDRSRGRATRILRDVDVRGGRIRRDPIPRRSSWAAACFRSRFTWPAWHGRTTGYFAIAGNDRAGYGISVPTQTRKRGAKGPLFHNHVAALFFNPRREHLATVAETAAAMKAQFAAMVRAKVAESFDVVLDLMRPLPSLAFHGDHPGAVQRRTVYLLTFVHGLIRARD